MWDALVTMAEHALATDLPPDCHGARPRVTVTTSLDVLRRQIDWATLGSLGVDHRRRPRARPLGGPAAGL